MSGMYSFPAIKSEHDSEGGDIRACRGCLVTGVALFNLREKGLAQLFGEFTGIPVVSGDGYPQSVCVSCKFLLSKFFNFRMRCHSAMYLLQQMHGSNNKVTTETLASAERAHLKLNLFKTETQVISLDGSVTAPIQPFNVVPRLLLEITPLKASNVENDDGFDDEDDKPLVVREIVYDDQLKNEKVDDDDTDFNAYDSVFDDQDDVPVKTSKRKSKSKDVKEKKIKVNAKEGSSNKVKVVYIPKTAVGKKMKKEYLVDNEQEILKTMANILRRMWMGNKNSDITEMWERVYQRSRVEAAGNGDFGAWDQWSLPQQIDQYLYLTRKLCKFYNAEVKFLSSSEHKKEIEEKRVSEKYTNAPYRCEFCCKTYVFEDTYKRHMASHDPSAGDVECAICRYRFKNRKRYMNHFHIYHTKKIVCRECGVVNRGWSNAKQHYQWHRGATTVCEQCGKHFPDKKLYCMHIRSVHRELLATALCLLCGDTYNGRTGLRLHTDKTHRQAERCDTCSAQFASAEALAAHNAAAADTENGCAGLSPCPQCGAIFESEVRMREHYDSAHKREFKCTECEKVLSTLTQFTRHTRKCKAAPRSYRRMMCTRNRGAGAGARGGDEKRLYNLKLMCELCGKGNFKCYSTLRSHQRVHTGERPFQCHVCHKAFRELQFLKNHMKTHTDERRYKCPYCAKAFRQLGHRAAHILTHTKERPYACGSCSKRYTGQTALKEHVNTAHRGLPPRPRARNKDRREL